MSHWYPKASKTQDFSQKYPGSATKPNVTVLHSTEGTGWPGYNSGATAPNFTARPNFAKKTVDVRQHFPANRSSRALVNKAGGVETNTLNAIQIELVGTCDPATKRNWERKGLVAGKDFIYMPDAPEWFLKGVAELITWINKTYPAMPIKDAALRGWGAYPNSYGNSKYRLSFAEWNKAYGIVGHQHVPENAHGDPGNFPIAKLIELSKGKEPTPVPTPKTKRFGRHLSINIQGNDGKEGTKTALVRIPQIVADVVKAKAIVVDCQEVRSGSQLTKLTEEFAKEGFARTGYYKEAKLATFVKRGTVNGLSTVVRKQFVNQNAGQKEGVLARTYEANGLRVSFGQVHLDYRDNYDNGRVKQAKEGVKELDALAKADKAQASVFSGDMNSKTWVTDKALEPAGYHEAFEDLKKDHTKKIDHTYLKGAVASSAFQRATKSDHKMQITDINVYV